MAEAEEVAVTKHKYINKIMERGTDGDRTGGLPFAVTLVLSSQCGLFLKRHQKTEAYAPPICYYWPTAHI